jgi:hypothetical protein
MSQRPSNELLGNIYMQLFHQNGTLINEQHLNDINPIYEIADTSRIPINVP